MYAYSVALLTPIISAALTLNYRFLATTLALLLYLTAHRSIY
jgi:hypothetical protein